MLTAAAAILAVAASAASAPADGKAALERLKALAGEWHGTAESASGPPAAARYEVGSAGTIVRELLFPGTDHETASAGDDLVFDFDGGTNLVAEKDPHVHGGHIRLVSPDRMEQGWTFFAGGKPTGEKKLFLTRKK